MARRKTYTKVIKENQIREKHVQGKGDTLYRGFQCLNPKCKTFLFAKNDDITEDFTIQCTDCKYEMFAGGETKFYDYKLYHEVEKKVIEEGIFSVLHDEYLEEAKFYKYCIVCNTIKPVELFSNHGSRKSGRQSECILCKNIYNTIKNKTRITDQHREAAQKRRMYIDLAGGQKINSKIIHKRFQEKCFKCGKDLSKAVSAKERPLDHTLPVYNLWPLNTDNATLLCQAHNGEKSGKWPSQYYSDAELKRLSVITGIDYKDLSGNAFYNPDAIKNLQNPDIVDALLTKYSAYMNEIIKLRNRLLKDTGFDFFKYSKIISPVHIKKADDEL